MFFGTLDVREAEGCFIAHSQKTLQGRIAKGSRLNAALIDQLLASDITTVMVARLDPDDIHENDAASLVASSLSGTGVRQSSARHGRVNLYSTRSGLCVYNRDSVLAANSVDEAITIAALPENQWVPDGKMLATVKIIPYAASSNSVAQVVQNLAADTLCVHRPLKHAAILIQTRLPALSETVLDKTRLVTTERLLQRDAVLQSESRCAHAVEDLTALIRDEMARGADWILIAGASAISDRRDVLPTAIVNAGGSIDRYGIPVDPGNLLLLAHIESTIIIGLPGCARSPRFNGLDQLLDRLACGLPITSHWINSLSIGGLLAEIADRPKPRVNSSAQSVVSGLILAAGTSSRAGSSNKLLHPCNGVPLISHVVNSLVRSRVSRVVAVTGHDHKKMEALLAAHERIECVHNVSYASGIASSLSVGLSRLIESDAVIVCLGDMPHVPSDVIDQLVDAYESNPDKSFFVPTYQGKAGNPVLIAKVFFDTLLTLRGDKGARFLIREYPDKVHYISVDCWGVLKDYDTQQQLSQISGLATDS